MQISRSPVPAAAFSANTAVVTSLKTAHDFAAKALQQTESGASADNIAASATAALQAATDAFEGARALDSNSMLEGTGRPSGSSWVDGQQLDGLGNPTRGGDVWAGPDGQHFDGSGNAVGDGGGFTGPDGETYSGI